MRRDQSSDPFDKPASPMAAPARSALAEAGTSLNRAFRVCRSLVIGIACGLICSALDLHEDRVLDGFRNTSDAGATVEKCFFQPP
jgi:hypothetical protein